MTKRAMEHWTCPHGLVTGFFPVPGQPLLVEHRSCGICCDEISEAISPSPDRIERLETALHNIVNFDTSDGKRGPFGEIAAAALTDGVSDDKEKAE